MKVGFTGTQTGMNGVQKTIVLDLLAQLNASEAHHGDCVGADAQFHAIVTGMFPQTKTVVHPPTKRMKRAFVQADEYLEPKHYLDRNQDIVNGCDIIIACPKQEQDEQRSGTWATIRYAKKTNKPITIVYPSARIERIGC